MEIGVFVKKVCNAVEQALGGEYSVECREVRKNNGVLLHGLTILPKHRNLSPTIYLDCFWEAYEAGMPFASVIRRILAIYREDMPREDIDMKFFQRFGGVKDRICYRLINREENAELLEEIPHIEFLDLAVCFYYAYQSKMLGEGNILIDNSHMEMWRTSTSELLELAQVNTPRLYPCLCLSMQEILHEVMGQEERGGGTEFRDFRGIDIPMSVLSNAKRIHGAVCMLYPKVLEKLAAEWRENFYILPSSIHEVILLKEAEAGPEAEGALKRMIVEINRTQVAPEEVLSDHLYCYDFNEKKVRIV